MHSTSVPWKMCAETVHIMFLYSCFPMVDWSCLWCALLADLSFVPPWIDGHVAAAELLQKPLLLEGLGKNAVDRCSAPTIRRTDRRTGGRRIDGQGWPPGMVQIQCAQS
jgi:hypothetical protein